MFYIKSAFEDSCLIFPKNSTRAKSSIFHIQKQCWENSNNIQLCMLFLFYF